MTSKSTVICPCVLWCKVLTKVSYIWCDSIWNTKSLCAKYGFSCYTNSVIINLQVRAISCICNMMPFVRVVCVGIVNECICCDYFLCDYLCIANNSSRIINLNVIKYVVTSMTYIISKADIGKVVCCRIGWWDSITIGMIVRTATTITLTCRIYCICSSISICVCWIICVTPSVCRHIMLVSVKVFCSV